MVPLNKIEYGVYGDLSIIYPSHILSTSGGRYAQSPVKGLGILMPHAGPIGD